MKRSQFTFYRSYFEAIKSLPKRDMASVILAICAYALDEDEPNLTGVPLAVFTLIRPTLDSGRKKAEDRTKRKAKKHEREEEPEPQTASGQPEKDGQGAVQNGEINRTVGDKKQDSGSEKRGQREAQSGKEKEGEREIECEIEGEIESDVDDEEEIERDYHWDRTQQATPTAPATEAPVTGFDGVDLSAEIEANRQAQAFIRRYGLADTEVTLAALMEDIGTRGLDAVRSALEDAAASDNRGGISVRYYRAILANHGKARPVQPKSSAGPVQDGSNNPFIILARKYGAAEGGDGP